MEILQYEFMQRALLASLMVGLAAPAVGIFLVQRRLSLLGDGLGHVALVGVGVGVLTSTAPVGAALVAAIAGAVLIELVRARGRTSGDVALAVLFYGGIAGGVVLLSLAPSGQATNLDAYLFGAITTTSAGDLAAFGVITVVILSVVWLLGQRLYAVSDDEEYARAVGLPVLALNVVLAALVASTVVLSMRVVGLLLISALMILPSAVAQLLAGSFRQALLLACGIGLVVSLAGTTASYYTGTPSGGTIVLLAIALFLLVALAVAVREATGRRRHRRKVGLHAAHPHEHGEGCGHRPVPHGDHVDYDHDGHLHAPHRTGTGVHYDEHGEHPVPAPVEGKAGRP
ncbi:metal ABC transporter permease [Blastococcus sp. MG754426]|uniref:metal ABC transporter permease n=1 Tax=unclassified Blastococcus TaxID=2619396 RepID=UPI001EF047E6|nr:MULTISPECIES: metal ABC transporter permease [unclassified Blastococcus]MCF6507627.1 metal ABC transporter permease [Blastococcus sp. MG754426]MCF6512730.1 metal ABC transporter permease [Blastococcus sp. MG754427]MCF6737549.1 metal ABC transporter permease [Blastococcus sp. KM273129]